MTPRRVISLTWTGLAAGLMLFAFVAPGDLIGAHAVELLRLPIEAVLLAGLLLALPDRGRRVAVPLIGGLLGILIVVKLIDAGFYEVLDRPFDVVLDWSLLGPAYGFLGRSVGRTAAVAVVAGVGVLGVGLVVATVFATRRLTNRLVAHRGPATRGVAVLAVAWVLSVLVGLPLATQPWYDRAFVVAASLRDRDVFAGQLATDAYRLAPASQLLTGLRGKDIVVAFVESYGRVALADPRIAPSVRGVLDEAEARLSSVGYRARSGFLTSPTAGGGSWLAHATLLGGVWVDNQQRHADLLASERMTLNRAFQRAGWRTVGVMPGVTGQWPEGSFFGYDRLYTAEELGYAGPAYTFSAMPDQYALAALQRLERGRRARPPLMAEIPLITSHAPWAPIPAVLDWDTIGDGSGYPPVTGAGDAPESVFQRDLDQVRADYARAIGYTLTSLLSYVERYGDEDLVLVFLGDHQPAPIVAGDGATHDVPVTILTSDPAVLDRIAAWDWTDGLYPAPGAPVWPMDTFRDRFLTAYGPQS